MSAIIKRYLHRFAFHTLCLLGLGLAIYLAYFLNSSLAQSSSNLALLIESVDLGEVTVRSGFELHANGDMTVQSSGRGLEGRSDSAHFVFQSWKGDGDFIVRVQDMAASAGPARAGLMLRDSLNTNARQASVGIRANGRIDFLRRRTIGGPTDNDGHGNVRSHAFEDHVVYQREHPLSGALVSEAPLAEWQPVWLRLVRKGNVITAYHSQDGRHWEWVGTESLDFDEWIYVGLVVAAHDPSTVATARFDSEVFQVIETSVEAPSLEASIPVSDGDGLLAEYYADRHFGELLVRRVDPTVGFEWGLESPVEAGPSDGFSVRWEGLLEPQFTEPYQIHLIADDHASLWLDGRLLIDDWFEHPGSESTTRVQLEAGRRYHLRIDYLESRGDAAVHLAWSSPSTPWSIVPQSQLHSDLVDLDADGIPDEWERAFGIAPGAPLDKTLRDAILESHPDGVEAPRGGRNRFTESLLKDYYAQGRFPGSGEGYPQQVGGSETWKSLDLAPNGASGKTESLNGTEVQRLTSPTQRYRVVNGQHPWVLRDDFHFSYRLGQAGQELVARITDIELAHPDALAGVMVRGSTVADSPFVGVFVSPTRESWVGVRRSVGEPATLQRMGTDAQWVRAIRQGNAVRLYESGDGESWRWLATEPFGDQAEALYGLAQQGGDLESPSSVTFADVSLTSAEARERSVPPVVGTGDGLSARYSAGVHQFERIDPKIDFYWGPSEAPAPDFVSDHFTVGWEGEIQAQFDEVYCLELACDEGARLWLDGLLLLDDWHESQAFARSVRLDLEAGRRYPIRVEYFEATGEASARLSWSSPSTLKTPVPQSQLYSQIGSESFGLVGRGIGLHRPHPIPEGSDESAPTAPMGPPDPNVESTRIELVKELDVTRFRNPLGEWEVEEENGGVISRSRRGSLEYAFELAESGMFLLEITAEEGEPFQDHNHRLWLSIDGQHLSRRQLTADPLMVARQLTPWLAAGEHRLEIYWDNALLGRSIRFRQITLQSIDGPDEDQSGVADWIEAELMRSNGLDPINKSRTSPACVEGDAVYWALASGKTHLGHTVVVHPGAGERWYANVSLDPATPTRLEMAFENGGWRAQQEIHWEVTDLTTTEDLVIRQGDSLLLTIGGGGRRWEKSYVVSGGEPIVVPNGQSVPHRFDEPGLFPVTARWARSNERTVRITVLGRHSGENPAALVGQWRSWRGPDMGPEVTMEADPRLDVDRVVVDGETRFRLRTWEPITRHLVLRVGNDGAILQNIGVEGFRLDTGRSTGSARIIEQYENGALLVETDTIMMPRRAGVSLHSTMATSGIVFSSGHLIREYPESQADELGILVKQYYLSARAPNTISVHVDTYHNSQRINEF